LPADGAVLPIIESATGMRDVDGIAASPGVQRLAFGTLDYAVDLDLGDDDRALDYPSAKIAIASRAAGIGAPVAGVTPSIDDEQRLLADLAFARRYGFGAKLCIHPKQVAPINRAFAPAAAEVDWARRVIAAAAASEGAVQVDGKMVDRPVLLKAQAILARNSGPGPDF
jgi:citrate lyase subunit beta / citryl-CoA lyase